jgi:hypothetical protein
MKRMPARTAVINLTIIKKMFLMTAMVMMALLFAHQAFAQQALPQTIQAQDFGDVQKNLARNGSTIAKLIAMIAYVGGTFFAVSGLLKLKDWVNNGDKSPMLHALMRLIVATLLILLPYSLKIATGTFFKRDDGRIDTNIGVTPGNLTTFQRTR